MKKSQGEITKNEHIMTNCIQEFKEAFIRSLAFLRVRNEREVNCGFCNSFADAVGRELDEVNYTAFDIISNDNFVDDEELPDSTFISNFLPNNMNRYNISEVEFATYREKLLAFDSGGRLGYHMWLYDENTKKHYDIECSQGVRNVFELPFFQRQIEEQEFIL